MRVVFLLLLIILLLNSSLLKAVENHEKIPVGKIHGVIYDIATEETLAGVNVFIANSVLGSASGEDGAFTIENIPVGKAYLMITYMGYKSEKRQILIDENDDVYLKIGLRISMMETSAIVVTGTTTPYLYEEAPVKTEVIPRKLIEQTHSCNLAEALSLQTGVRIENNCQNCNFTQVRILGFDGKYSQLLIDGDPVVSTLAGVYALEQFPNEMIDQIEIVKGGGSALYGAGAMAGTINLRTRRPYYNRSRISYDTQSLNGSLDHRAGIMTELVSGNERMGAYIFGSFRQRDHYDHNGDGYSEIGTLLHKSIGVNAYFRPLKTGEFKVSFHRIQENRRGGNDFDKPEHEADIAESLIHNRWGGKLRWSQQINAGINYQAYYAVSLLDRDSYYGGLGGGRTPQDSLDAFNCYGATHNLTQTAGVQSAISVGKHQFTVGGQYSTDHLADKSVKDVKYHIDKTYTNSGVYLQDDIKMMNSRFNIVIGARMDIHSEMTDPVISPRLNLMYELADDLYLRAAYATGFKAPQTFDEDLHIQSLGGNQRVIRNASNLKPELSRSFSMGLEYQGYIGDFVVLLGATGFVIELSQAFTEVEIPGNHGDLILWQRINSSGAKVSGIEVDAGFKPTDNIELRLGVTYKKGFYYVPQEIFENVFSDQFLRTPDTYGYFRASYDVGKSLNLFGAAKYTGSMYVPNESIGRIIKTPQTFLTLDAGLTYELSLNKNLKTSLAIGVKNISNDYQRDLQSGVNRDPSYVYGPPLPRRIYIGIEFSL